MQFHEMVQLALQVIQAIFYIVGGVVAVLTYISAKNGLLNTVNTEYHKRVIDNIHEISLRFISEFDIKEHGGVFRESEELFSLIERRVDDVLKENPLISISDFDFRGTPLVEDMLQFRDLQNKYSSDPFLPNDIRDLVVEYYKDRINLTLEAHTYICPIYALSYLKFKRGVDSSAHRDRCLNQLNSKLYDLGVGISQLEERVHNIRIVMRNYFAEFDRTRSVRILK